MADTTIERKPRLPFGAYTEIARRCDPPVSISHARRVYLGLTRSAQVEAVIEKYVAELQESGELEGVAVRTAAAG